MEKVTTGYLSFVSCELSFQPSFITASYTSPEKAPQLSLHKNEVVN